MRPPPGTMVFWRWKKRTFPQTWRFGYCTYTSNPDLIRMGFWNGDTMGGSLVSASEIEWKPY